MGIGLHAIAQLVFKEAANYKRQATIETRALLLHFADNILVTILTATYMRTNTDNRISAYFAKKKKKQKT